MSFFHTPSRLYRSPNLSPSISLFNHHNHHNHHPPTYPHAIHAPDTLPQSLLLILFNLKLHASRRSPSIHIRVLIGQRRIRHS